MQLLVLFENHQNQAPLTHHHHSNPNPLPFSPPSSLAYLSPFQYSSMKRPLDTEPESNKNEAPSSGDELKMKKKRHQEEEEETEDEANTGTGFVNLDENLLFEVLKHVDARTLGRAACVSKQWHRTVQDERLWELICTRHWANTGCGNQQLRSVVLALGGFRRLHSQYLWHLSKPQSNSATTSSSSSTAWNPFPPMIGNKPPARWGKDEMHLSLSLLSIRYYEKMNFTNRGR